MLKLFIASILSVCLLSVTFFAGSIARALLNMPHDLAVFGGMLVIVTSTFGVFISVRWLVNWGILPLFKKEE